MLLLFTKDSINKENSYIEKLYLIFISMTFTPSSDIIFWKASFFLVFCKMLWIAAATSSTFDVCLHYCVLWKTQYNIVKVYSLEKKLTLIFSNFQNKTVYCFIFRSSGRKKTMVVRKFSLHKIFRGITGMFQVTCTTQQKKNTCRRSSCCTASHRCSHLAKNSKLDVLMTFVCLFSLKSLFQLNELENKFKIIRFVTLWETSTVAKDSDLPHNYPYLMHSYRNYALYALLVLSSKLTCSDISI